MARKCPICHDNSLDYDPVYKKWRCLWADCFYEEDDEKEKEDLIAEFLEKLNNLKFFTTNNEIYTILWDDILEIKKEYEKRLKDEKNNG